MSNACFAAYYERRLNDAADGVDKTNAKSYPPPGKVIPVADITQTSELTFDVVNSRDRSLTCTVDLNLSMCTCNVGMTGAPCKHQLACAHHFEVGATNLLLNNDATRSQMSPTGSSTDVAACRSAPRTATSVKPNTSPPKKKKRKISVNDMAMTDDNMAMTDDNTGMTDDNTAMTDDNTAMTGDETIKKLDAMRADMVKCLGEGNSAYRAALERMLEQYARLSPSARISAFIAFGQSSDVAATGSAGNEEPAVPAGNGDHVYVNLDTSNFPNHNVLSVHYPDGTIAYPEASDMWSS